MIAKPRTTRRTVVPSETLAQPPAVPPVLKAVFAALAHHADVRLEKGWGSGNVVLKHRGTMFVLLHGDELVVKLPRTRVDELVATTTCRRFDPRRTGQLMKEWLVLPPGDGRWVEMASESLRFVSRGAR